MTTKFTDRHVRVTGRNNKFTISLFKEKPGAPTWMEPMLVGSHTFHGRKKDAKAEAERLYPNHHIRVF